MRTWLSAIIPCSNYSCGLAPLARMPVKIVASDAFNLPENQSL